MVKTFLPAPQGSVRLFQAGGITVFLHWSWFIVAIYEFSNPGDRYSSRVWNVVEYLALFAIVLMHEFGHALACRQVGGKAEQIVLWPLGGVAYVNPPQRPGPTLWSIVAGPLVNLVLLAIFTPIWMLARAYGWWDGTSNFGNWFRSMYFINVSLLVFNLLPIYPLDGGQILRSLLWFVLGRGKSLAVSAVIGLLGVVLLFVLAVFAQDVWFGILAVFILMNCWRGLQAAMMIVKLERLPRHPGFACPNCHAAPPMGVVCVCPACRTKFDTFATLATCPKCAAQFAQTQCLHCGAASPISAWVEVLTDKKNGDSPCHA